MLDLARTSSTYSAWSMVMGPVVPSRRIRIPNRREGEPCMVNQLVLGIKFLVQVCGKVVIVSRDQAIICMNGYNHKARLVTYCKDTGIGNGPSETQVHHRFD